MVRFRRVLRGVVLAVGVVGLVPVAAGAQGSGPRFVGQFEEGYDAGAPIDASGAGCPATGGPPSATPPGVFVASHGPGAKPTFNELGLIVTVENGQVVFTPDSPWAGIYEAIYFPVEPDGTWSGVMPHGLPAFGLEPAALGGLCTTLLRLTPDGESVDPASIEEATFVSPAFEVWVIPYQPSSTTTSTTSAPAPAVQANPSFTG